MDGEANRCHNTNEIWSRRSEIPRISLFWNWACRQSCKVCVARYKMQCHADGLQTLLSWPNKLVLYNTGLKTPKSIHTMQAFPDSFTLQEGVGDIDLKFYHAITLWCYCDSEKSDSKSHLLLRFSVNCMADAAVVAP